MDRKKLLKKMTGEIKVVENMRNYDNEPAFIKKRNEAIEFLKKNGLPEDFKEKKKK